MTVKMQETPVRQVHMVKSADHDSTGQVSREDNSRRRFSIIRQD